MAPVPDLKGRVHLRHDLNLLASIQGSPILSMKQDRELRVKILERAAQILELSELIEVEVVQSESPTGSGEGMLLTRVTAVSVGKDSDGKVWVGVDSLYTVSEGEEPKSRPHDKPEELPVSSKHGIN